jgi:preprotein translocase subunit YajC
MNFELFIPIVMFLCMAVVAVKYFDARHKQRMAMIEKGMRYSDFIGTTTEGQKRDHTNSLKWGLVAAYIGVGLFIGVYLNSFLSVEEGAAYTGSMLVCGGLGLVHFYLLASAKQKKAEKAAENR